MSPRSLRSPLGRFVSLVPLAALVLLLPAAAGAQAPGRDRDQWHEVLGWPDECEEQADVVRGSRPDQGLRFYALGDGRRLLEVTCSVGVYQLDQIYLVVEGAPDSPRGRLVRFPSFRPAVDSGWTPDTVAVLTGLADFDTTRRELIVATRYGRAIPCGAVGRYAFRRGRPVLLEFRGQARCDDADAAWTRLVPADSTVLAPDSTRGAAPDSSAPRASQPPRRRRDHAHRSSGAAPAASTTRS